MPVDFAEIRRRRLDLGFTHQEAGEAAGREPKRARQWWADLESGRFPDPQVSRLEIVAKVLGCRLDALLSDGPASAPAKQAKPAARKKPAKTKD